MLRYTEKRFALAGWGLHTLLFSCHDRGQMKNRKRYFLESTRIASSTFSSKAVLAWSFAMDEDKLGEALVFTLRDPSV